MGRAPAEVRLQRAQGCQWFVAAMDPLDADRRCTHSPDRDDQGIVWNVFGRNDGDASSFPQQASHIELAVIGIAASAGT
jgi:hypothetical protein